MSRYEISGGVFAWAMTLSMDNLLDIRTGGVLEVYVGF